MKSVAPALIELAHWVVLSIWFGGIGIFSFLVAPAAFRVLPTPQLAGELVGAVLSRLYIVGTFAGVILLITSSWFRLRGVLAGRRSLLLILFLLTALASNVYGQWSLAPHVGELRRRARDPSRLRKIRGRWSLTDCTSARFRR